MSINHKKAEKDFLSGKEGIVWATYKQEQSEIISNALLAQNIYSEIGTGKFNNRKVFLIIVPKQSDAENAIDFIWKDGSGLCLKPDWYYPSGEKNESFERWLNGNFKYKRQSN